MTQTLPKIDSHADGFFIRQPKRQTMPFVFNSPHSGTEYPAEFLKSSALELDILRRSEDYRVDHLFAAAPDFGAPIMYARFPRCFLDLNREPYELDPEMFDSALPPYVNATSPRVISGLGAIAKICSGGHQIYSQPLSWPDGLKRIQNFYMPYHHALHELLKKTKSIFGAAILIDCHSMPSHKKTHNGDDDLPDIVIGDCHGAAAHTSLSDFVYKTFSRQDYRVARNDPYAGGFITEHYGRPDQNIHALQIEINRALYMDEDKLVPSAGWTKLLEHINYAIQQFQEFDIFQIKQET